MSTTRTPTDSPSPSSSPVPPSPRLGRRESKDDSKGDLKGDSKHGAAPLARPSLNLMANWKLKHQKQGGANGAGQYGGIYVDDIKHPNYRVLFKQDETVKNICEVVAGGLMRDLSSDPTAFAEVAFSWQPNTGKEGGPDLDADTETGENVYVASVFFPGYHDLLDDAYMANAAYPDIYNPPALSPPPDRLIGVVLPAARPKIHEEDITIKRVIRLGRYKLAPILAVSQFFGDPDVHVMNIGAIPDKKHGDDPDDDTVFKQVCVTRQGKENKGEFKRVYEKVKPVRIDYGGALASKKITHRRLDGQLHPDDPFTMFSGPPNYILWYPSEVVRSLEFAAELRHLGTIPQEKIAESVGKQIDNAAEFYGVNALIEFGSLIGAEMPHPESSPEKAAVVATIKSFMTARLVERQQAARELATKIQEEVRVGGRARDSIKAAFKRVYNRDNLQRSDRDAFLGIATPGNKYNQFEMIFIVFTVIKNCLKLVTEYLPAVMSALSAHASYRIISKSVRKQNPRLNFSDQALLFLLFITRFIGEALLAVGSRITSPIRAANEMYDLIYNARWLNKPSRRTLAKGLAYIGYGLSLASSIFAIGGVTVLASSALAAVIGSSASFVAFVHAIPYLNALGHAVATALAPVASAMHMAVVEPALAAVYAGFSMFLAATILPLRMLAKRMGKQYTEYEQDKKFAGMQKTREGSASSFMSSTARYGSGISLSENQHGSSPSHSSPSPSSSSSSMSDTPPPSPPRDEAGLSSHPAAPVAEELPSSSRDGGAGPAAPAPADRPLSSR